MDISDWLTWATIKAFANSNFFRSSIGALAGAFAGAWAAQRIAARGKVRDELLQDVRNSNAAIELAHGIASTYLNLKEQHVRALWQTYESQKSAVQAHHEGLRNGTIPRDTQLDIGGLDLGSLTPIKARVERLEEIVVGKLSVSGRPRPLMAVLAQTIDSLNETISQRNEQVTALKADNAPLNEKVAYLFGLPRNGMIDETFGQTVTALYKQTDDCIYFSKLLCSDLAEHGERVRDDFKRRFRGEVPRIQKVLWDDVEKKGLFPPKENYATWHTAFWRRVPRTYGRRGARIWYWMKKMFRKSPIGWGLARLRRWRVRRNRKAAYSKS